MDNTFISTELFKHLMEGKALGLTKREYFAAMAMQGYCSVEQVGNNMEKIARFSVEIADALLSALEAEPNS